MTVDADGRLYVATYAGLQVFDTTGRLSGVILKPQHQFLSNVTFAGPGLQWLYVTCSDKVYRRKTKATGVLYFGETTPRGDQATGKRATGNCSP
jgi:sugar lactone lactonase YvrE